MGTLSITCAIWGSLPSSGYSILFASWSGLTMPTAAAYSGLTVLSHPLYVYIMQQITQVSASSSHCMWVNGVQNLSLKLASVTLPLMQLRVGGPQSTIDDISSGLWLVMDCGTRVKLCTPPARCVNSTHKQHSQHDLTEHCLTLTVREAHQCCSHFTSACLRC